MRLSNISSEDSKKSIFPQNVFVLLFRQANAELTLAAFEDQKIVLDKTVNF